MAVRINPSSRLLFGELLSIDDVEFWDVVDLPEFVEQSGDLLHEVSGNDRIDLLAHRYYQNPVFWWVIAVANNMEIIPIDLREGDIIRIPDPEFVKTRLLPGRTF